MSSLRWSGVIGIAGLLASIMALALALMVTIDRAADHFQRAAIAQAQFGAVLKIARAVESASDAMVLTALLKDYRTLIGQEAALLPADRQSDQLRESARAARLATLVEQPLDAAGRRDVARIVAATAVDEQREAADEARAMQALRYRTWWLAGLLTAAAVGSAVLGSFGLLTANRRLAGKVAERTAEIAAIDASRRLFFAKASHELRTPVTVMRGEAEVALSQPGSEREALSHVVAQSEFFEHRIAELLALAQAEDGRIRLSPRPAALDEIIDAARQAVAGYARSNDVTLAVGRFEPVRVLADWRWLEQALVAVLDNAVKFSPEGGTVRIDVQSDGHRVAVSIADQGAGMMPAALPKVFDAFYQATDDPTRGGSGLGLALARWVVDSHDGTIAAANRDGGGCVVTMNLPVLT